MHTARVAPEKTAFSARPAAVLLSAERMEKRVSKLTYQEQLKHPNWQKRRLEIMQRDEFTCQMCFDTEATLHVHHKHYIKGRMAWEYNDDELITLCVECHESMHSQGGLVKDMLSRLPIDGPTCVTESIALVAGWAYRGMPREDMSDFREQSPYSYEIGRLASVMSDIGRYDQKAIRKLVDLLDAASYERRNTAMLAFVKALKED